jgi:membrane protein YdbS with pleckstrin-like domain
VDEFPQKIEIEINRPRLEQYIKIWVVLWSIVLIVILVFTVDILLMGLIVFLLLIFLATLGNWLIRKRVAAYEYHIEGKFLRMKRCIFFKKDFFIPLDEVKSFTRYQGPLMRYLNIGGIYVERGGSPVVVATVEESAVFELLQPRLLGLKEAEKVIDLLGKIKALRTMKP